MKKLYNKYFYISKHERIREKVMAFRIAVTATLMIICLAAMSFTAYAYFSGNVSSGSNIIKAANFETTVSIDAVELPATGDKNIQYADLLAGEHTVTVKISEASKAETGFCVMTVSVNGNDIVYYTQQLGTDKTADNQYRDSITFKLVLDAPSKVTFSSHWGTSIHYDAYGKGENGEFYITQKEPIEVITIVGSTNSVGEFDDDQPTTTPSKSTETEQTETEQTETEQTETEQKITDTPDEVTDTTESADTTKSTDTTDTDITSTESSEIETQTEPTEETTGAEIQE